MKRHSVSRTPSRTEMPPTNVSNNVTILSLNKQVQDIKRDLRDIRRVIELQTEVLEDLLINYRNLPQKAKDLITPRS